MLYETKKVFLVVSLLMGGLVSLFFIVWLVTPNQVNTKPADGVPTNSNVGEGSWLKGVPGSTRFSLQDVINTYGLPDYVRAAVKLGPDIHKWDEGLTFPILFVYLEKGFVVGGNALGLHSILNANIQIDNTYFFAPQIEKFLELNSLRLGWPYLSNDSLVAWQGFTEFAVYCRYADAITPKATKCGPNN